MKISESTTVLDALKMSKVVIDVFRKYKLDCAGCMGAGQDTIRIVAENNGLDPVAFLRDLNDCLNK